MAGHHFHVHGPHDHEMEHAAKHAAAEDEAGSHAGQLAVLTAVLATVGALFGYMAGATQANASLYKNEAAIKKTEAANRWNYFQSKSTKQSLAEFAAEIVPDGRRIVYQDKTRRYEAEKAGIQAEAEKLEQESREWDDKSEQEIHTHHRWAQAMTDESIAIAMAAIALLTKKRWTEYAVYAISGVGLMLGGLAAMHV